MASLFDDKEPSLTESIIIRLLRQGKVPTHIGFIMDGNRRYARQRKVEKLVGHSLGFEKLAETLRWCRDLGVRQATVYAFSIENFKRPPDEVTGLMNLFRRQFAKVIEEFPKFDAFQICIRVYGRINLLPDDIQDSIAKVVERTAKNDRFYLNVALAYTAREEICTAISTVKDRVEGGQLPVEEITEETLSDSMYSAGLRDPDILIRTSGEVRLSDFLLWQTGFSYIFFTKELWPDFSIWSLFVGILHYQMQTGRIRRARECYETEMRLLQQSTQQIKKNGSSKWSNGIDSNRNPNGSCAVINSKLSNAQSESNSDDNLYVGGHTHHRRLPESCETGRSERQLPNGLLLAAFLLLILFCAVTSALFVAT